eukprot:Gb_20475 [translate_table: standard]
MDQVRSSNSVAVYVMLQHCCYIDRTSRVLHTVHLGMLSSSNGIPSAILHVQIYPSLLQQMKTPQNIKCPWLPCIYLSTESTTGYVPFGAVNCLYRSPFTSCNLLPQPLHTMASIFIKCPWPLMAFTALRNKVVSPPVTKLITFTVQTWLPNPSQIFSSG